MTVLLDTGPLLSLADRRDPCHERAKRAWRQSRGPFLTSVAVIPEAAYLLLKYLGPTAELGLLESWRSGEIRVEPVTEGDLRRVLEILRTYRDQEFGFTDAALFAMAERLKIRRVMTLDYRHFDAFQPSHCASWEHVLLK